MENKFLLPALSVFPRKDSIICLPSFEKPADSNPGAGGKSLENNTVRTN